MAECQKKATEVQQAMDAAAAALATRQKETARWEAAKVNALIFTKRDELATLTARFDDLTEELAASEKSIAEIPAQLAQAPADQKPTLEKRLAQAQSGLAELKAEKAATEAKAAALRHTIDTETQRYLSILPK